VIRAAGLAILAALVCATPALAEEEDRPEADAAYDYTFVDAFQKACVPQRLSFEGTKAQALSEGWKVIAEDSHPELAAMMALAHAAAVDPEYPDWKSDFATYTKDVLGQPVHLVVTYLVAPGVMNIIGCYLYDFEIDRMIDPSNVDVLMGETSADSIDHDGLVGYVWGPTEALPRTLDTYLTLIHEGSPHAASTGFSGLMLKFETSEPEPDPAAPAQSNT
jgi:hypothetical protein